MFATYLHLAIVFFYRPENAPVSPAPHVPDGNNRTWHWATSATKVIAATAEEEFSPSLSVESTGTGCGDGISGQNLQAVIAGGWVKLVEERRHENRG